jgi:neutral ceramidase
MATHAGIARRNLNPFWGVELTGWGYYLNRTWLDVHDDLNATSLVIENENQRIAIVSVDLMVISAEFTRVVRQQIQEATGIPSQSILVSCTHTHNAPASEGLRGVGEVDPLYEAWAARQAATSAILAWQQREAVTISAAATTIRGISFNRTRDNGPVDETATGLRVDRMDQSPLAVVVGFQAHPTVATVLRPRSVSRDAPGQICDVIERELPGCTAIYLQGACGDVNFLREYATSERHEEPGNAVAAAVLVSLENAESLDTSIINACVETATIPTRRWAPEEIAGDQEEARRRLEQEDVSGWRKSIGRAMTNRPDDMVARHGGDEWKAVSAMCRFNVEWTEHMQRDMDQRPETLSTEVQALRIGDFGIVTNSSEFFTTLALEVRARSPLPFLMLSCYSNGRIGYMPDAYDVERKTYAAYQSPKYCNQFPFTSQSGPALVDAMIKQLQHVGD